MIRYLGILILLITCNSNVLAQEFTRLNGISVFSGDTAARYFINIEATASHSSNCITNSAIDKLLFGGNIDPTLKNTLLAEAENTNRFGAIAGAAVSISLRTLKNKPNVALTFKASHTSVLSAQFSRDGLGLTLYGNTAFGSEKLGLSPLDITLSNFQKLGVGLMDTRTASFFRVNLYHGLSTYSYHFADAVYQTTYGTAADTEYADALRFSGEINTAETGASTWGKNWGAGIDAQYTLMPEGATFGKLIAGVMDLGAIYWKDLQVKDTSGTASFQGFSTSPLDGKFDIENLIDSIIPATQYKSKVTMLPAEFFLKYYTPVWKQWYATASGKYIWSKAYTPRAELGVHRIFSDAVSAGVSGSYGGYTQFSLKFAAEGFYKGWLLSFLGGGIQAFSDGGTTRFVEVRLAKIW